MTTRGLRVGGGPRPGEGGAARPGPGQAATRPGGAARRPGRPARLLARLALRRDRADGTRPRWSPSARWGGASSRPTRTSTSCCCTTAARTSTGSPRSCGTRCGTRGSASTTPCARPAQAVQVAATDLRAAFGLLEARHLAGDPELSDKVGTAVRQAWRAGIRGRFDEIADGAHDRWRKQRRRRAPRRAGPQERPRRPARRPADRRAGRRPARRPARRATCWTAVSCCWTSAPNCTAWPAAPATCCAPRTPTRWRRASTSPTGSSWPGRCPAAARSVAFAAEVGLRQAAQRAAAPRARRTAARRRCAARSTAASSSTRARSRWPATPRAARDPALVLRVAATAARTGLPVAAGTLHRLADTAPELREPWPRAALGELLSLLGTGRPLVDVVESLDRTGLWGRLFPEWGAVRDLPPRDRAHIWTVDRHLVEACAHAARLTTRVARPDLLLVGALLHDIGKGRGGDHSVVGGVARRADRAQARASPSRTSRCSAPWCATTCCCRTPPPGATWRTRRRSCGVVETLGGRPAAARCCWTCSARWPRPTRSPPGPACGAPGSGC